ncbi:MAG: glycosyltransferase family 39 protein [Anaerolineae bacterium]|nr:glycosyltransferase family 39 protein [Anaerolineae bacterium]
MTFETYSETSVDLPKLKHSAGSRRSENLIVAVLLIAVLLAGAYFRFVGQNWDDFTHLHPDERFLTQVAEAVGAPYLNLSADPKDLDPTLADAQNPTATRDLQMAYCLKTYPDTGGVGDFFDSRCSPWYPVNIGHGLYVYGELPLYVVKFSAEMTQSIHMMLVPKIPDPNNPGQMITDTSDPQYQIANAWTTYNGIHLVGRTVSAIADLLAVFFVFLIGRRLYNKWVGLIAAALMSAAVLHIQLAHFWTADAFTVLPVVIAFYFAARAQDTGSLADFIGFGIFMGASVASRVNTLPLVGVIGLAALMHALPVLDAAVPRQERVRMILKMALGLVLMGIFMLVTFRFAMPHAFQGGPGLGGILNIRPYGPWLSDVGEAQYLTSGAADIPPNHQWTSRIPYFFAWWNMVAYGMGLPLGLMAWAAFAWGGIQILRAVPGWTRHALPVVWVFVYFALMGRLWVMAMRYYIVLYPFLCILAAWALVELFMRARAALTHSQSSGTMARLRLGLASLLLVVVIGGAFLYATMFTSIYRRQLTRVQASTWVIRNIPGAMSATFTLEDGHQQLVNLPAWATTSWSAGANPPILFTVPVSGTFQQIDFSHILTTAGIPSTGTLQVSVFGADNVLLAEGSLELSTLSQRTSQYGDPQSISLDKPVTVEKDKQINFVATISGDVGLDLTGTVIATEGPWDDPIPQKVCYQPLDQPFSTDTPSGLFNVANCGGQEPWNYLYKPLELYMAAEDDATKQGIMQTALDSTDYVTISSNRFYDSLSRIPTRFPMSINYYNALFSGQLGFDLVGEFTSFASIGGFQIADQNLPFWNTPKWYNELEAEESFTVYDHPTVLIFKKTDRYQSGNIAKVLAQVPLTDATAASPMYYDTNGRLLSENNQLVNVIRWGAQPASAAPTAFEMSDSLLDIQTNGGTWSELFNRDWLVNSSEPLTVAIFWLTIILFGWIIYPLLWAIFPGLADRGYALAKIAGLLVVSWIVWALGTLRFTSWSSWGILLTMILVAVVGLIAVLRRDRGAFFAYVRMNWRHFAIVEMITLIMFLGFLLVRLGNPDLWHPSFGGEKPMDFAYFNAVLRSTVFPPVDPWYAGGYLNYYYYGYVLAGTPIKLLGIVPSVAYNLLVPTMFALTGITAFGLGFNLVAARWFLPREEGSDEKSAPLGERLKFALKAPGASPYIAGVLALLLTTVLGNLHTPSVALEGVIRLGGCTADYDMVQWLEDTYTKENGAAPDVDQIIDFQVRAETPGIGDSIAYGLYMTQRNLSCLGSGISNMSTGATWPLATNRWFWAARSIVGELPGNSSEIGEFPMFTFTYGDLHAHMIAMPMTLLVLGWLLAEILIVGRENRATWKVIAATILGGLAVGILRPTNTWDWPTYLALGVLGLGFTLLLRHRQFKRVTLIRVVAQIALFFAAQFVAAQPFMAFFATSYSAAAGFLGNKTPIWAYVDMHGQFLFFIVSYLIWQTARVLRHVYVRDLLARRWALLLLVAAIGLGIFLMLFFLMLRGQVSLVMLPVPIAWICIPLLIWCLILFFVPYQTRETQIMLAMTGLALGLTMVVELVVLAGDNGRQNTFFKFYMQIWFLYGIVAAVAAAWLIHASSKWNAALRVSWLGIAAVLLATAALYPIVAPQAKNIERFTASVPATLDGDAYMEYASHYEFRNINGMPVEPITLPLKDDLAIIRWLQDNVKGTPAILEARQPASEYKWNLRIAINTGLPSVVGWNYHQKQQRTLDPLPTLVEQRGNNVSFMYNSTDVSTVWGMLRFYRVKYIIVGKLEQAIYTPEGLLKFDAMADDGLLRVVFENEGDKIYQVVDDAAPSDALLGMALTK